LACFFDPVPPTYIHSVSLHDALPISPALGRLRRWPELLDVARNKGASTIAAIQDIAQFKRIYEDAAPSIFQRFRTKIVCAQTQGDRKSTRLNSSHQIISYAVFCLKKT